MRTVQPWLRFIEGAEGGQAGAPQEDAPAESPAPAEPVAASEAVEPSAAPEVAPEPAETFDRNYVEKLRKESASYRERAKEKEGELNSFLEKLKGLTGSGEEEQTPEQLIQAANERAEQAARELQTLKTERAIQDAAGKHNADTTVLLPLLRGLGAFDALDSTADDYASQVESLVAETVEKFPQVKTSRVPASSGNAPTPTPHEHSGQIRREDLKSMTSHQIIEAKRSGKLDHLF